MTCTEHATTLKDLTIEVLKNVSPTASLEEIMYKINLAAQVMEGIKEADEGKVISTQQRLDFVINDSLSIRSKLSE